MVRKRVIEIYDLMNPRISMEEKIKEIQRSLEVIQIKVKTETIKSWIKDYEQKLKKIQKEINLKTKEEESYIKFDITGLRYRDPFEA
ncbi:MAG: hypothetical protein J7L10_05240, partial [Methanomicrobia archaeon]|nr:hypothetical protein [Methanomicrobia archaeon]